jgi:cellulose synthase (UDP-forming)
MDIASQGNGAIGAAVLIYPDPGEKNLGIFRQGPSENEMLYGLIHPGLDFWNASFFCGTEPALEQPR